MLLKPSLSPETLLSSKLNIPLAPKSSPPAPSLKAGITLANTTRDNEENRVPVPTIPIVHLDLGHITTAMAARLAHSLVGHVLFLKSQVPFPVVQLTRIPSGDSDNRSSKKRDELVAAMDTLSSHLHTTFLALSTALAHKYKDRNTQTDQAAEISAGRAHIALVVGPSVGAAKARVMLVIDGLEVKLWGARDNMLVATAEDSYNDGGDEIASESTDEEDQAEDASSEDEQSDCVEGSDGGSLPPPSRSPSPEPPLPTTVLGKNPPLERRVLSTKSIVPSQGISPRCMPLPTQSQAEEEQILKAAERLLSRTLANHCAEDDGGMASELAPTQTHVLLRAPRRFVHPAWIPRQNLTHSLDGALQTFLADATPGKPTNPRKSQKTGVKTEGLWIGCLASSSSINNDIEGENVEEDDELIWWSWDGKIVGFSDW